MLRFSKSFGSRQALLCQTMATAIALSCWTACFGQEVIVVNPSTIHPQSASNRSVQVDSLPGPSINKSGRVVLPNGYVHLGDDVLNCEECRRRLGLPPLAMSTGIIPQDQPSVFGPRLSGPVQSDTSAQSSFQTQTQTPAQVVPQPSVGLSGLPFEARRQLLQGLSLPEGATILSAKFIDPPVKPVVEASNNIATTEVAGEVSNEATRSEAVANPIPATLEPTVPELAPISNVTSQKNADSERAKPAMNVAPDAKALVVDGVLRSPALQQIQIDFLKKQLLERDDLIQQINSMQPAFQQQLDDLARGNDQLRKREQELTRENQQIRINAQKESQKHDMNLVEIKAELFAAQQQLRDQEMVFNDKMVDVDKANFSELVKLRKELSEIQKDKAAAIITLRQEIDALTDSHSKQTSQLIDEQQKIVDEHLKSIDNLERQLESVRASQALDLKRIESIRDQQKAEREAKQIQAEPTPSSPLPSPALVQGTVIEPETQAKESKIDDGVSKPFELPVPNIKETKPKIPRIENRKPAAETTKSF